MPTVARYAPRDQRDYTDPHAERVLALEQSLRAIQDAPDKPMFTPEELAQRQAMVEKDLRYGQLAGLSNDRALMNMAAPTLARAKAMMIPKQTEHGEYDATSGSFRYFPQYERLRREEIAQKALDRAAAKQTEDRARWDRDQMLMDERAYNRSLIQGFAGAGSGGGQGSVNWSSIDPVTGEAVYTHNRLGLVKRGPNGEWIPFQQPAGPKPRAVSDTMTGKLSDAANNLQILSEAIPQAQAIADKGGWANASMGIIPGMVATRGPAAEALVSRMQPAEVNMLRERLSNTIGLIRAGRYGLTLTKSEIADALQYLPNQYSSAKDIVSKAKNLEYVLKNAHQRHMQGIDAQRPGLPSIAPGFTPPGSPPPMGPTGPSGPGPQQPMPGQAPPGQMSPQEMQELEQLRRQFGGAR